VEVSEELSFYEMHGSDGRPRIVLDDGSAEPSFMQSIVKYRSGTPMFRVVSAAILASESSGDALGLYWPTKAAVRKALAAARKAAKAEKRR
jgi:hypothetical protein